MTQDDILRMALDADAFGEHGTFYTLAQKRPEVFASFATLVASAEREECASICKGIGAGHAGRARRLDGQHATHAAGMRDGSNECAAAIRARGSQ